MRLRRPKLLITVTDYGSFDMQKSPRSNPLGFRCQEKWSSEAHPDNAVYHCWHTAPDGEWSGWESLGGTATSKPAATLTPDGRLTVFVRGTDNLIWYRWHVRENGEWSEWKRLGDPRVGGPGATTVPGFWSGNEYWIGWLSVFARGSDNALWHRRLPEMV